MKKVAFLSLPGLENFVKPVADKMSTKYETKLVTENSLYECFRAIQWADIIWLEWANELAWKLTTNKVAAGHMAERQVVVRYHSYEVFYHTPALINWSVVDDVIFVADHVKQIALKDIAPGVRQHVIPNGLDHNIFGYEGKMEDKINTKQLVLFGHLNHKKGLMLLAHCFYDLQACTNNGYHLHIAGDVQDERYSHYLLHIFEKMQLLEHITLHSYIDDVPGFLQDKSHVICSSPWESQNLSVMEGMLCGLKPVVHDFPGAVDIYPEKHIWSVITDFTDIICEHEWNPYRYREWVVANYPLEKTLDKINHIFRMGKVIPEGSGKVVFDKGGLVQRRPPQLSGVDGGRSDSELIDNRVSGKDKSEGTTEGGTPV